MSTNLILGDCLEKLKDIPDKSIDFILADPPYGTTACKWDIIIPFEAMWRELKRIIKDNGAVALFGSEPFSSHLRISNIDQFKYDWIWKKSNGGGFLNANRMPLKRHEIVSIFYYKQAIYNPQKTKGKPYSCRSSSAGETTQDQTVAGWVTENNGDRYPITIQEFSNETGLHPTQKPVALLEYLIKTYTLEGETVLDFTMGSGSTGVACVNTNRNFIGIEKDEKYFEIAKTRIYGEVKND
jgi:site-specific DNA-methyltransferase (adenine-specific)